MGISWLSLVVAILLAVLVYLSDKLLFVTFSVIGVVSWAVWHLLTMRASHLLISRRFKNSILISVPLRVGKLGFKETMKLAFLPTLFIFSVTSLVAEIIDYPIETFEGLVTAVVAIILLLPVAFFVPAKLVIESAGILAISKDSVNSLTAYPYIDEFLGFGAILSLALIMGKYAVTVREPAYALGVLLAFFCFILYPSLISSILYAEITYFKAVRWLKSRLRPLAAELTITVSCYHCGYKLSGVETVCPNCGYPLRIA